MRNKFWGNDFREYAREFNGEQRHWRGRNFRESVKENNGGENFWSAHAKKADNNTLKAVTVYIGDLPKDIDETWLKHIFSGAGKILEAHIPAKRSFRWNQRYGSMVEGLNAIKVWNNARIQGHHLLVKIARFGNTKWNKQGRKIERDKSV